MGALAAESFNLSEARYDNTMDINVKGVVFIVQNTLPLMTGGGLIIGNASFVGGKSIPAHASSKV